jgi:hypothetical protein
MSYTKQFEIARLYLREVPRRQRETLMLLGPFGKVHLLYEFTLLFPILIKFVSHLNAVLMAVFISLFVLSCIQQLAQYYQFTIDEAESQIMRESLPENIKNMLVSPNSGKIRLIRARNIFKQFHPSRPVSPRKRPSTVDSFSESAEMLSSKFAPMTPPFEAKSNRIFWQGRLANSKVVDRMVNYLLL